MAKRDAVESKEKILKAAEEIFAEAGFDGARVDDIARKAGVNKALIYYYFDSKDTILNELCETLMEKGKRVQNKTLADSPDVRQEDVYRQLLESFLDFTLEHKRLVKIGIAESMKAEPKHSIILRMADQIIDTELESIKRAYEEKGYTFPFTKRELVVSEFFTGIMPIFNFAAYFDDWMSYYNMSEKELREYFLEAFKETHVASHLKRYK